MKAEGASLEFESDAIQRGSSTGLIQALGWLQEDGVRVCTRVGGGLGGAQKTGRGRGSPWAFLQVCLESSTLGQAWATSLWGGVRWVGDRDGTPAALLPGSLSSHPTQPPSTLSAVGATGPQRPGAKCAGSRARDWVQTLTSPTCMLCRLRQSVSFLTAVPGCEMGLL